MSDYTGPGVYQILSANAPTKAVSVWEGGSKSGTAVKLFSNAQPTENLIWEIVAAGGTKGDPEVGDRQYHIIGVESGLMLCAAEDGSDTGCTISTRSVRHPSSRWKIVPAGNGNYYFASVQGTDKRLAVKGAETADGAILMTWPKADQIHFQFILKKPTF